MCNMDKTGILLSVLGTLKVLVGSNKASPYQKAGVRRDLIIAIKCIFADDRSLPLLNYLTCYYALEHMNNLFRPWKALRLS
jgi:hypothetical protein